MAITAKVVTNTLATTGDTAFTSSGFGTPDAAIILISRGNTTTNPEPHSVFSGGFWCSDPAQVGITFGAEDASASSDSRRYGGSSYAGPIMGATTDSLAVAYSASATTDGINLTVATGSTGLNRYASVILIKGATNAHVGAINLGTGTSAIDVTAPGFRADLVLMLSPFAADATIAPGARGCFGAAQIAASGTVAQGCIAYESQDAEAASNARTLVLNDAALVRLLSGAIAAEYTIGANSNGFSITPSANSASTYAYYLAIECPDPEDAYVAVVDTITGTGDQAYSGAGLTPQALILASTMATAVDTVTNSGTFSVGVGGPATSEWATYYTDEYASDPTDTEGGADTSNILRIQSAVGSTDTIASLVSLDADGWTLNYSDGSASARKMLAIAIGNSSAGGTNLTVQNAGHAHAADGLALTTEWLLSIADAAHAHTADGQTLTVASVLAVAEALHTHVADNLVLSTTGTTNLTIQEATHPHAVDALTLVTDWLLTVADALHSHAADNLGLTTDAWLVIADSVHAHLADGVTLTTASVLAILEAVHAHAAEALDLFFSSFTEAQLQEILAYVEANMAVPTAAQIAAAVWAEVLEGTLTAAQIQRIKLAALAGKRQGLGTVTEEYLGLDGITPRVTFTPTDASGNGVTVVDGA